MERLVLGGLSYCTDFPRSPKPAAPTVTRTELEALLRSTPARYYIYVLRDPDGCPFYVGLGQGTRLLAHEEEARNPDISSAKCERIRQILALGGEIDYQIDSWHDATPWLREEELIRELESMYRLTNAQRYATASESDGVVLRKYAGAYGAGEDVRSIPADFPYMNLRLMVIIGRELVLRLHDIDWSDVKSAYAEGRSQVSGK